MGAYSVRSQFEDSGLSTIYDPCPYYRTIEHLHADNPDYELSYGSLCNYPLGEGLFSNLDRSMSDTTFAAAFRSLHQRLSTYEQDNIDQGLSLWTLRMGSRPSSRSVAIRLSRLTPRRCWPRTTPSSTAGGVQRRRQAGQVRAR